MAEKLVRFDWAVKKLLRSKANFGILEGFLSELLKFDIKIVELLESESNKESKEDKFNRVDLKAKTNEDELIIIEVQINSEHDFLSRMLYGASKVITEHMKERIPYKQVKKVYSVNVIYFDLGFGDDYVYIGQTNFVGMHTHTELELSENQKLIYKKGCVKQIYPEYYIIKVNQFNDFAKDTLDEWIYFLKNDDIVENVKAKGLKEAKEKLNIMKLSKEEKIDYEKYVEEQRYQASMYESHYGIGLIKGKKEGRKEGREEGREEGENIKAIEIAKNLLDILDDEMIAKKTGLDIDEVKKLR